MSKRTCNETNVSPGLCSHRSEREHEPTLTFIPKPFQAACCCLGTHGCIEFTRRIPFWRGKEVVAVKSVSKNCGKWKREVSEAGEPKGSGVWAQSLSEGSSLPLRSTLRRFCVSGFGGKSAGSAAPLRQTASFARTSSTRLFFVCLIRAL